MNVEIYKKCFDKLNQLGCIRRMLTPWCQIKFPDTDIVIFNQINAKGKVFYSFPSDTLKRPKSWDAKDMIVIGHNAIISDVLKAIFKHNKNCLPHQVIKNDRICAFIHMWNLDWSKLKDQSDVLWEEVYNLLSILCIDE